MKKKLLIFALVIGLLGCNTNQKENSKSKSSEANNEMLKYASKDSKGYELMTQKCYMCHFEKPDPAKMDQMIAPPMLRIQEHYKPSYPGKNEFIDAMVYFINNPSVEKTLMPGAVKKFKLMPKLIYDDGELRLIAETIYDYDFGSAPRMRMQLMGANGLQLNHGKKWKLKPESVQHMDAVIKKVNNFSSEAIADYNQLGAAIFNDAKHIMLDDAYTGEKFNQIHLFFNGIEGNMHLLMAIQSMDEAKKQLSELKTKLNEFHTYFENNPDS